jgi:hypothetical protein
MPNHFRYLCEHPKYQHGVTKFAKKKLGRWRKDDDHPHWYCILLEEINQSPADKVMKGNPPCTHKDVVPYGSSVLNPFFHPPHVVYSLMTIRGPKSESFIPIRKFAHAAGIELGTWGANGAP